MATNPVLMARTGAAGAATNLFSVTSGTAVVTNIVVANTATTSGNFSISLGTVALLSGVNIPANSSAFFDVKQVVPSGFNIYGQASATTINFHISGVVIN